MSDMGMTIEEFNTRVTEGVFGEIYSHDNTIPQDIATGTTYIKVTPFTDDGESSNCTPDFANGKITITESGRYDIDSSISYSCDTNNVVFFGAMFAGGVKHERAQFKRKVSTAGDVGSTSMTGKINVTNAMLPLELDARMRHDNAGTVAITISDMNINITRIGNAV